MNDMIKHDICGKGRKIWTTPAIITATIVKHSEGSLVAATLESPNSSVGSS